MFPQTYSELVDAVRSRHYRDANAAQTYLHDLNVSLVMAIRVTRAVFSMTMGDAKNVVSNHFAWRDEAESARSVETVAASVAREYRRSSDESSI